MNAEINRQRTAIRRYGFSRPIALALADGIISTSTTVFDYGCGHGEDLRQLRRRRIHASGWDPHYGPEAEIAPADIVNLGYVLNVIENPNERRDTLTRAWELARQVLIIAVRVDRTLEKAAEYSDGLLTAASTFQKLYSQNEFREYVEATLSRKSHVAALGVVYVFKDEKAEVRYLATHAFTRRLEYRQDLLAEFARSAPARRYVRLANELGRMPLPEEFKGYQKLVEAFGSPKRIERLSLAHVNHESFEGSRVQRREDILFYLAMLRLQGLRPPPLTSLPSNVRGDLRAIWPTYIAAQNEGDQFLFSLGQPELVRAACASSEIGKLVGDALYIHRSAEDDLTPLLRLMTFAARQIVGDVEYNLIKLTVDGRAVSFLAYADFDNDPHPVLLHSVRVYLPRASYDIRDYTAYDNPPILHRKETFVASSYPHYREFKLLTDMEESLGLLSMPNIGNRSAWQQLLLEKGLRIEDHRVRDLADGS